MWISLVVLLVLLMGSAFCSASETALFSLNMHQREDLRSGGGRAALVLRHIERPHRTLATLLLANMVLNVVISVIITGLALEALGETGLPVAIATSTMLLLLFGEIVPKTFALRRGVGLSPLVAPGVEFLAVTLTPIRILVERLTAAVVPKPHADSLDSDQLSTLLQESRAAGEITPFEAIVLQRALDFGGLQVDRILTPRVEMVGVEAGASLGQAAEICRSSGRNRIVVYEEDLDHVVGVLLLKDLLGRRAEFENATVRELMREAIYVPANVPASVVFAQFQSTRMHLAVVVDEHGGTEGVVSLEDVLEALVGDIRDESDAPAEILRTDSAGNWRVDARMDLEEFEEATGLEFDTVGDENTFSGLLERLLGRVPRAGDSVESGDATIEVLSARPTRAANLLVRRQKGAG